jgi:hypothetical protein
LYHGTENLSHINWNTNFAPSSSILEYESLPLRYDGSAADDDDYSGFIDMAWMPNVTLYTVWHDSQGGGRTENHSWLSRASAVGFMSRYSTPGNDNTQFTVYGDVNGDGLPERLGVGVDIDGTTTFVTSPYDVKTQSNLQSRSVNLERVLRFSFDSPASWIKSPYVEMSVGTKYFQLNDAFQFNGTGGLFGNTTVMTGVDSQYLGPQFGLLCHTIVKGWQLVAQGGLSPTWNDVASYQTGLAGDNLAPPESLADLAQPTVVSQQLDDNSDSMMSEFRLQATRALTDRVTLSLGYSGYYFDSLRFASNSMAITYPSFGLLPSDPQEVFVTTAFANLEFRR